MCMAIVYFNAFVIGVCTRAAPMKYHKLDGVSTGILLSQGSGDWRSEIEVLAGFFPSKDCEGESL